MRPPLALIGACVLAAATGASGCGASEPEGQAPTRVEARRALADAPAPLAALHRQGGRLLAGGQAAFDARLAALRGRPVVVNAWAEWCAPCRAEFALFQRAAVGYGTRVGFLGVDVKDDARRARTFLREHWVAYPSYVDRDERIARAIGVRAGLPTTVYYDRRGEVSFVHQGPYRDAASLSADVRRYALRS